MPPTPDETGQHVLPPMGAPPTILPPAPAPNGNTTRAIALVLLSLGSGVLGSVGYGAVDGARLEQRVEDQARRVGVLEGQIAGVESLRREVARLDATLTAIDRRTARIENALDSARAERHE